VLTAQSGDAVLEHRDDLKAPSVLLLVRAQHDEILDGQRAQPTAQRAQGHVIEVGEWQVGRLHRGAVGTATGTRKIGGGGIGDRSGNARRAGLACGGRG
jgi:hypothetical protein